MSITALLIVTEDGFAKRVPVSEIRTKKHKGGMGVMVSSVPVVATLTVEGTAGDLVIASTHGKVERIGVSEVPIRRRNVTKGNLSKGLRVMRLRDGDRVASAAIAADAEKTRSDAPVAEGAPNTGHDDLAREAALFSRALGKAEALDQVTAPAPHDGPRPPMLPADEWERTEVHRHSRYWCGRCGLELDGPHAFYEHRCAA
jgi:DNA gyrase/topoisomerase IV subunit A